MQLSINSKILAIDTSFDETAVAMTQGTKVLSNEMFSQIDMHQQYGGVVPSIAKLAHAEKIEGVITAALQAAQVNMSDISAIAVTRGPGLSITLAVGIEKAKQLAQQYNLPLVAVNHMEGHLLSVLTDADETEVKYPVVALLVSGGHTEIVLMTEPGKYQILGETYDDAAGEAYDKAARMMGLNYPGGPEISKLASQLPDVEFRTVNRNQKAYAQLMRGEEVELELPLPMIYSGDLNMSFSGLKTAFKALVLKEAGAETLDRVVLDQTQKQKLSYLFEAVVSIVLVYKLKQAANQYSAKEVWLGGGVSANQTLQNKVKELAEFYTVRIPTQRNLMVDNAAMIGIAAGIKIKHFLAGEKVTGIYENPGEFDQIDRDPIWSIADI